MRSGDLSANKNLCPSGLRPPGRWHNHIPSWILEHPTYSELNSAARQLLQVIADDGTVQSDGGVDGGFGSDREYADRIGASAKTVRRQLQKLVKHPPGFLIIKMRGGKTRLHQRTGTLTLATAYRIAGTAPTVEDSAVGCPLRWSKCPPPVVKMSTHYLRPNPRKESLI